MDTVTTGGKHAWQARTLVIGSLLVIATVAGLLHLGQPSDARAAGPYLYTQKPCVNVYSQPSTSSTLLTQLLAGTEVAGTDKKTAGGKTWQHVQFWVAWTAMSTQARSAQTLPRIHRVLNAPILGYLKQSATPLSPTMDHGR